MHPIHNSVCHNGYNSFNIYFVVYKYKLVRFFRLLLYCVSTSFLLYIVILGFCASLGWWLDVFLNVSFHFHVHGIC